MRLFGKVITPTVLYGCATWTMTAERDTKLRSAQRKMLRKILGKGRQKVALVQPFIPREVVQPLNEVVRRAAPTLGWHRLKVERSLAPALVRQDPSHSGAGQPSPFLIYQL